MKINVISDLHGYRSKSKRGIYYKTGFDPNKLEPADVLVVAGDLGYKSTDWQDIYDDIMSLKDVKFKDIIFVKGNHDFYNDFANDVMADDWNFVQCIDGVYFICTPLWTPIIENKYAVKNNLNDYYLIPNFTVEKSTELYYKNIKFIKEAIQNVPNFAPVVIVTHHMPHDYLCEPRYIGSKINEAFCVSKNLFNGDMEAIMKMPNVKYWIYGHTHTEKPGKERIPGCDIEFCRNPIGYHFNYEYANAGFNECKFVYDFILKV